MGDSQDNVRLTSFRPLSPETTTSIFSLARFFQRRRPEARVAVKVDSAKKQGSLNSLVNPRNSPQLQKRTSISSTRNPDLQRTWSSSPLVGRKASYHSSAVVGSRIRHPSSAGSRNVHAVLGRLDAAAGGRGQLRQEYKESNFKQYWMPDENCKECYECGEKFNTFRRRHHCRLCGQIFCYTCCYLEIPGLLMGYTGQLRVCTYCFKIVQGYTQLSPDVNVVRNVELLQSDPNAFATDQDISTNPIGNITLSKTYPYDLDEENFYHQPTLRKVSNVSTNAMSSYLEKFDQKERQSAVPGRSPFDAFGVCAAEADMLKQDSFRELWNQIMAPRSGLELQCHRFRLRTYQNCLVGSELVDWLLMYEKTSTRNQAVMIGQSLLEFGWLEPVPNARDGGATFKDEYILYQPGVAARELASPKKSSLFWSEDKAVEKNESISHSYEHHTENVDDDNDETVPHWFRQLGQHSTEPAIVESDTSNNQELPGKLSNLKVAGPKLLDLDLTNGLASEQGDSELSLKVDLNHFGEHGKLGSAPSSEGNKEVGNFKLSLITDVPPPPLEQYVYSEGYPHTPLRPSNKKPIEEETSQALGISYTPDEIFSGAMMAKEIRVDKSPSTSDLSELREDNEERLAMERLRSAHAYHLNTLLVQLLKDAGLSLDWKDTILPLVKRVSEQVSPDVRKDDDMHICEYVKFKKIPGGNKRDCEMICGVVFTKNIANKKMSSVLSHPKLLVLSCAIDYQRNENRLASLDPLILQEFEFLKNFVARVVSLRPNILIVEKTVSRLAQDMLLQHGITLVLNVKPTVVERIARCTRADILCSMEQLSRPQLGMCQSFKVQRFCLKNGESKTLIFIDGCPTDLGCTVILRGGNNFVLSKVKHIFQHMVYVAYSLKLELHFLMDEFALPPDTSHLIEENKLAVSKFEEKMRVVESKLNTNEQTGETEVAESLGQDFQERTEVFLSALKSTILSSSPLLDYPIPYLLTEAGRNFDLRSTLPADIYWSVRIDGKHNSYHLTEEDLEQFDVSNPHHRHLSKFVSFLEPHPFVSTSLTMEYKDPLFQALLSDFRAQGGQIQLTRNGKTHFRGKSKFMDRITSPMTRSSRSTEDRAFVQDTKNCNKVSEECKETKEQKEKQSLISTSPVHVTRKSVDCLDPYSHQRIAVLFISYSNESNNSPRPCISPWAVFMEFYGRNDITLGGFLEIYCFRPSYICPNPNCDVPMVDHVRYFAHGTGSVYIHMRNLESPIPGFQHTILTWSWCKECKQVTPIVPLSPEAWALSFAKYLELRFYAGSYKRRASVEPCGHSLHKEHYQYFAYANMVASFKYRPIKLFEIAIPPRTISIKEKTRDASLWIDDIKAIATRGTSVFASFCDSLESLRAFFSTQPDRQARMQQFFLALMDEQTNFMDQVDLVEKKALSLQAPQNPLATEDRSDQLGPDDRQALEYVIANSLNSLKKTLCEAVEGWNHSLQEYIQAEKRKNGKTSSTKDGKFLSSSVQVDGKSSELLPKSFDVTPNREGELNLLDVNPSPSLTPWGSRSTSPYPSLNTGESADEMPSEPDKEVFRVNSGFQPISNVKILTHTPGSSPSEGILPVGGVISDKSESLARVILQNDDTARPVGGSLKTFYIEPKSETKRQQEPCGVKTSAIKETPKQEIVGRNEPYVVRKFGAKESSEVKIAVAHDPNLEKGNDARDPTGVNMGGAKETSQVKMATGEESSTVKMVSGKKQSSDKMVACAKGAQSVSNSDDRGLRRPSSWYVAEEADKDSGNNEEDERKPSVIQTQCIAAEINAEESARPKKTANPICAVKAEAFTLGHRRVASSPPSIEVTQIENRPASAEPRTCELTYLEKSRSDSDIRASGKHLFHESIMSSKSKETDASSQPNMADMNEARGYPREGNMVPRFRKVDSMPSSLKSKPVSRSQSWAVNQWQTSAKKALSIEGDLDAPACLPDGPAGTTRRAKVKRIVSSFMSSPGFQPVSSTFPNHEHHLLPPGEKVLVVVSEKETSSIIAYTLSTTEYNEQLHEIQRTLSDIKNEAAQLAKSEICKSADASISRQQPHSDSHYYADKKIIRVDSGSDSGEGYVQLDIVDPESYYGTGLDGESISVQSTDNLAFMNVSVELKTDPDHYSKVDSKVKYTKCKLGAGKDDTKRTESSSTQEVQGLDDIELVQFGFQRKDVTKDPVEFHVKHQFADSTCRFYCSIYYAEQFRLLRKRIFPDSEEKYIRSLQHSVTWGASGGKSGSAFFKSLDDRFVMKQMSRQELQCFLEFAPHYFRYVNKALDEQRPTLLAKILGIYRIGYKNSQTGGTMRQDVLVMENLFYDRNIDKTFDLKGSMRSRYVQTSGMNNDVLLDENLLEMIRERPIFFRPHSKAILSRAIHNDTEFLAQQMVMDYSLLVGIDEARSELVIGIIDFIRTFTWDKKLEMYVKASGILGGQGRMPTVVSPELYRTRFTEAMHRYFLMVPDKWTGLGNDLE
ncbi:1-phosphatidylinositol 3-phosphate 5-kinase-like isoform X2 [Montipora capricornis]|uniref:1-phosphatidylinositol 3-phosphate 5-kinase-like isoform X2 n=1 Tax=Montipora capricornis TaxID=246305 RepID=UPI0035F1BA9E